MGVGFRCDYAEAACSISGLSVECKLGGCVHYGKCLPVSGIRETPEHAVGEHTRERGQNYHNIINTEKDWQDEDVV